MNRWLIAIIGELHFTPIPSYESATLMFENVLFRHLKHIYIIISMKNDVYAKFTSDESLRWLILTEISNLFSEAPDYHSN